MKPASRPISSSTMTRWCASAVVCSRSSASVAIIRAVSKPKVTSVPPMSLSIVLGTPMTGTPFSHSSMAMRRVPSPPMTMTRVQVQVLGWP